MKQGNKKGKVLVAMSGGIDSSISALLLKKQGYDLVGITMKTWDYESSKVNGKETGCCSLDSINDARIIAVKLGFPHYVLDIREEFSEKIINNFVEEYLAGRTPNPCVLCNTHIKWDALLKRADMLGCDYIATGHYSKIRYENGRYIISRGIDTNKDQTYVLWGLTQDVLSRTIFPLSEFTKPEVREIARKEGFDYLAKKNESYDICFIPDNDYRKFLKNKVQDIDKIGEGNFIYHNKIVGKHKGYPFYTIGQRKGLEIALGQSVYVKEIIPEKNEIILGDKEELAQQIVYVRDYNLIKYENLPDNFQGLVKIRYKDPGKLATIHSLDNHRLEIVFHEPVYAVAPGQSAVIYEGNDLVGGGFIEK
ncbi:MAG TPA: tRNA 2-thiouridine(34) synthase MnmA [Bacteroidia bacterium]|nr:tRNA 2-thiouridine(34) synthase MnmA [Bacteroidia bacterium]